MPGLSMTRSPNRTERTSVPTAATTPAPSAPGGDGEVGDDEIGAGERGRAAARQIRLHDLRDGAAAVLPLEQEGERAVAHEVGTLFLDLGRLREVALVRAVTRHQPDVVAAVPVRHERDGLAVRRGGWLRILRRLLGQLDRVRARDRLHEDLTVAGARGMEHQDRKSTRLNS